MNPLRSTRIAAAAAALSLAALAPARAQQALIIIDSTIRTEELESANALTGILVGIGIPTVTVLNPPPADIGDLRSYRCVMDFRIDNALSPTDAARMDAYLKGGGRLFLEGEHGLFFATRNQSLDALVVAQGGGAVASDPVSTPASGPGDILEPTNSAHPLAGCVTEVDYDGIACGHYLSIGSGTWLTRDPVTLAPSSVAWGPGQMTLAPTGRVVTALDSNFTSDASLGGNGTLDWERLNFPTIPTQNRAWVTNLLDWVCLGKDTPCGGPTRSCDPRDHGYWHRFCLGTGAIDPGRHGQGQGPGPSHDSSSFPPNLLALVDAAMAPYAIGSCSALDDGPFSDPRLAALRELATLEFNLAAGYLELGCPVELAPVDHTSGLTVGDARSLMKARLALATDQALEEARWIGEHVNNGEALVH